MIDHGGKREVKKVLKGLDTPNGLVSRGHALHRRAVADCQDDNVEARLDNPPEPKVIFTGLPKDEAHGWKFLGIGPDNKLYIPVGAPGNNVLHDADQARSGHRSRRHRERKGCPGVRNSVGFDGIRNKQL